MENEQEDTKKNTLIWNEVSNGDISVKIAYRKERKCFYVQFVRQLEENETIFEVTDNDCPAMVRVVDGCVKTTVCLSEDAVELMLINFDKTIKELVNE